ncbi:6589_t:CDS:2 [Dentiscutata erythropus]|uniref:6589_t:CDS:1 n=1 Tax=Dentiscutata erythropus TaxID=1348616 RepID=A0A9N9N9Z2_9GLOM|nr:6589_t:CDS:2 [Dentiscutata erythropus]
MSDYTTSEEEFDPNNDIIPKEEVDSSNIILEEEVDSSDNINEENATTMLPLQEVLLDSFNVNCSKNKTSPVWNFMSKQKEGNKVIARICGRCGQKFSPTRILGNHLSNKHGLEITLKRNNLIQRPYGKEDTWHKKECFDAILNLVVCCQLPFAIIENTWFQQMVNTFDPIYKLPLCQYIKKEIINQFKIRYDLVARELRNTAVTSLRNTMTQYKSQVPATTMTSSTPKLASKNKRKFFESLLIQQQTIEQPLMEELDHYLSMPMTNKNNSLLWWAENEHKLPMLAKIARDFLLIQGTNVPCEEAFSTAAGTITKVHNRLDPQTARVSLCLKSWIEQGVGILN